MKGSCHCGAIQFKASGEPSWVGRCHCRDCQKISGSAFIAWAEYSLDQIVFTGNAPKLYKSSPNITRTFCDNCGSPIEWRRNDLPNKTSIPLSLFDEVVNFGEMDDLYREEGPGWGGK